MHKLFLKKESRKVVSQSGLEKDFGELVRRVSIEKLTEDKVKKQNLIKLTAQPSNEFHELVINLLLRPKEWLEKSTTENDVFPLNLNVINELITSCIKICESQPMVLRLEAPIKIFGDIHG